MKHTKTYPISEAGRRLKAAPSSLDILCDIPEINKLKRNEIKGTLKKYFSQALFHLWQGIVTEKYIIRKYREAKLKVSGMQMYFFLKKDPSKFWIVPNSSRWNDEGSYKRNTLNKIKYHLTGLRVGVMLTLTFHKPLMEKYIPHWWMFDYEPFLIFIANPLLSDFLDQLRKLKKRYGKDDRRSIWNYIGWVAEFINKDGEFHYHFHILFFGKSIADKEDILRIWPYCEAIGVEFTSLKGMSVVNYLGKYAGKFAALLKLKKQEKVQGVKESKEAKKAREKTERVERALAWFKYFKRRLYSFRHDKVWNEKSRRILMREHDWFKNKEEVMFGGVYDSARDKVIPMKSSDELKDLLGDKYYTIRKRTIDDTASS